ncbi:MAG: hypothetical protein KBB83_04265 [Alphaproteobacteria bacterium]|nr:hypothetical protein [Alphaproteobacteria bacterium]
MRMIRYQGHSSQELLGRIRRELGPNALIVSTHEENGEVTIVAAIDRSLQPLCGQETFAEIKKCLIYHRVPSAIIDQMLSVSDLEGSLPEVMAKVFRSVFRVPSLHSILNDGSPLMLIGPPGVGKTLSLVKIAAQCKIENRPVQIFSTDRQKSGGCAQIEKLSEAMDTHLSVIENPLLLQRAVNVHKNQSLLLIDTTGTNPFDVEERNRLYSLMESAKPRVVLVLPCRGDDDYYQDMEAGFRPFNPQYQILTQIDLSPRLGHVVSRASDSKIPLVAISHMAEVAHLLIPTVSQKLSNLFIDRYDQHVQNSIMGSDLRMAS